MPASVLSTKLFVPKLRGNTVMRTQLIKRMKEGKDYRLILLCAPAGFGKTTLVSEYLSVCDDPISWLSLDERDNDIRTFLTYFIAGLQRMEEGLGSKALEALSSLHSMGMEAVMTEAMNEIAALSYRFIYILEDYHVINKLEINAAMEYFINYMPSNMSLIITTREQPRLPVAKLRARNQLLELRDIDLRFTQFEIAQFLNRMKLTITEQELKILEIHTEGWIAGIQLAALSMQNHPDPGDFLERICAGHTYIMDYLMEEVLRRQSEEIQWFLLKTSVLDRFCGELCDAMLEKERNTSQRILDYLQSANLFLVPLDNEKVWFRYHHLFCELLRHRWNKFEALSLQAAPLHRRAAAWFEEKGLMEEAIRHSIAVKDYEKAAAIIELEWSGMDQSLQSSVWLGWVKMIPADMLPSRPVLSTGYAWALLDAGKLEDCEPLLQIAEQGLTRLRKEEQEGVNPSIIVTDQEQYRKLPATIANARAYKASALGDIKGAIRYAAQALSLLPEEEHFTREVVNTLLGLSLWADGDLETAYTTIAQALLNQQMEIMVAVVLADIRMEQGSLHLAEDYLKRVLKAAWQENRTYQLPIASFYLGLAKIKLWQGDNLAADELMEQSRVAGEKSALPNWRYQWLLLKAQRMQAEGVYGEALECLTEAEDYYCRNPIPDLEPLEARKARLYVKQGSLNMASHWVEENNITMTDVPHYIHLYEHLTLIQIRMAEYEINHSIDIEPVFSALEQLLEKARAGKWNRYVIEILILRAIACYSEGKKESAQNSLAEAISLSEPEEYLFPFIEAGEPVLKLLPGSSVASVRSKAIDKIIEAINHKPGISDRIAVKESKKELGKKESRLAEPLSERELEILQLIADGLSNQEICNKLYLALSTVKGYNQNLFGKLEVKSRTEAIKRARELDLI